MDYQITQDYYVLEQAVQLPEGWMISDGDLDPDVIAYLLDKGTLVRVGEEAPVTPEVEPEPLPVEVVTEEVVPDEPAPVPSRRRGHE